MKTPISNINTRASLTATAARFAGLLVLGTATTHAADRFWSNPGTDTYNNSANWGGLSIPNREDNAFVNNGGTVRFLADPIWHVNDIRLGDPGTGNVLHDGAGADLSAWLRVGIQNGSTGVYTMNAGILTVYTGQMNIGEQGTGSLLMNGGLIDHGGGNFIIGDRGNNGTSVGSVTQTGGQINTRNEVWIGQGGTSPDVFGTYDLSGGRLVNNNWFVVGRGGGRGIMNMTGGQLEKGGDGAHFIIGDGGVSNGVVNVSAGTINCATEMWIGQSGGNANGTLNLSGSGVINVQNWLAAGREGSHGFINMTGGTFNKLHQGNVTLGTGGGTCAFEQSGGTFTNRRTSTLLGENGTGSCVWNLSGTGVAILNDVELGRNNTASGTFNINTGGTLIVRNIIENSTGTSILAFNGGTIKPREPHSTFIEAALDQLNVGDGGMIVDTDGLNITTAQTISSTGTGGITKADRGSLTLGGAVTVGGTSTVEGGILNLGGTYAGTTLAVANGAGLEGDAAVTANVSFAGGSHWVTGEAYAPAMAITGDLTIAGPTRIDFDNVPVSTAAYTVATYTGTLTGGANLSLGHRGTISTATAGQVNVTVAPAQTLTWTGAVDSVWDIKDTQNWNNGGGADFFAQADIVTLGDVAAGDSPITVEGELRADSINFEPTTGNTITLQAGPNGDFAGPTFLTHSGAGKVVVNMDTSLLDTAVMSVDGIGGELQIGTGGTVGSLGQAAIANNALLTFNHSSDREFFNLLSGTGSIKKQGAGTLTLRNGSCAGDTTVEAGRLVFRNPAVPGTGAFNIAGTLELDNSGGVYTVASALSGAGTLVKSGTGEVSLSGNSTSFTGPIEVVGGGTNALNIFHANAMGTTAAGTTVTGGNQNGGRHLSIRLLDAGGGTVINEPLTFNANGLGRVGLRHEGAAQTATIAGPITINSTGLAQIQFANVGTSTALNITGDITGAMNGAGFFFRGTASPINVTGSINLDNAELLITDGTPVTLGGAGETYSGFRSTIAFGTLRTLVDNAMPPTGKLLIGQNNAGQVSSLFLGNGGTAVTQTIAGIRSNTPNTNSRIAGGATVNSTLNINLLPTQVDTFGLPIGGAGANENNLNLIKSGLGRLILNAPCTYAGATTVQAGTLVVTNNLSGTSGVAVQAGATLTGNGSVRGLSASGVAGNQATIAPGGFNAVGTLSTGVGGATLGTDSALNWQINNWTGTAGGGFDLLNVGGTLNLTATPANPIVIRIDDTDLPLDNFTETNAFFDIVTSTGITGFNAAAFTFDTTGFTSGAGTWSISQNGNALRLTYTAAVLNPYQTYIAARGLTGPAAEQEADPDNDGIKNAIEFILGTEPNPANANSMSVGSLPTSSVDATYLTIVYNRSDAAIPTNPVIQYGSTLTGWTTATDGVNGVVITTVDNGAFDQVTTKIPRTLAAGTDPKLFTRLTETIP